MPPDDGRPAPAWLEERVEVNKLLVHDLKNPASAALANMSYLAAADLPADAAAAVVDSIHALRLLQHMLDGVVTLSRLEASSAVPRGAVGLGEFLRGAVARCLNLLGSDGARISLEGEVPDAVCEWEMEFASAALEHLIMTSALGSPPSSRVVVEASADSGSVSISVLDGGNPIDPKYHGVVFDRAFQVKAKNLPGARYGRVMGLHAVKLAAARLGGSVRIEAGGRRNRFVLKLPISQAVGVL